MFKCRVCSGLPFASFFGLADSPKREDINEGGSVDENVSAAVTGDSDDDEGGSFGIEPDVYNDQLDDSMVPARTDEEIEFLIIQWDAFIAPRSKKLWPINARRYSVLRAIAQGLCKHDDPFLSSSSACMRWHGEFIDGYPVVRIHRTGNETGEAECAFVTRLLVFLCGDEECFKRLDPNDCKYLKMACGNSWCVNSTHILV